MSRFLIVSNLILAISVVSSVNAQNIANRFEVVADDSVLCRGVLNISRSIEIKSDSIDVSILRAATRNSRHVSIKISPNKTQVLLYENSKIVYLKSYLRNQNKDVLDGPTFFYSEQGLLRAIQNYKLGQLSGKTILYNSWGAAYRIMIYEKDVLVRTKGVTYSVK